MPAKVAAAPKAALKDRIASFLDGGRSSGRLSGRNSFGPGGGGGGASAATTPAATPREEGLMSKIGGFFGGRKASVAAGKGIEAAPMTRPGRTPSYFDELTAKGVPVD